MTGTPREKMLDRWIFVFLMGVNAVNRNSTLTRLMFRSLVSFIGAFLLLVSNAQAECECRCVNGQVRPLCTNSLELPPICSSQICQIVPPSIPPIQPAQIPPLGTSHCEMKQVFNPHTGQYEWQRICQ